MKDKCCGNCARFFNEDAAGQGFCSISPNRQVRTYCHNTCIAHEWKLPKWTEITPDNVDEFNADLIVVTDGTYYKMANDWHASLSTLAKVGGYYYYVLPELKTEETK